MKFHIDFTASDTPPLENALEMDGWFCIVLFCFALLYISCSVVSTAIKKMLAFVLFCFVCIECYQYYICSLENGFPAFFVHYSYLVYFLM